MVVPAIAARFQERDAGVVDVRLRVVVGNTRTLDFYRKRGLVPTLTVLGRHGGH